MEHHHHHRREESQRGERRDAVAFGRRGHCPWSMCGAHLVSAFGHACHRGKLPRRRLTERVPWRVRQRRCDRSRSRADNSARPGPDYEPWCQRNPPKGRCTTLRSTNFTKVK
jgi:hypothetical protein